MEKPRPPFVVTLILTLAGATLFSAPDPRAVSLSTATGQHQPSGNASIIFSIAPEAQAAEPLHVAISTTDHPSGALIAYDEKGIKLGPLTLQHTEVKADISGPFATVEVSQTYDNPSENRMEAVYVFPLPEHAAVTDMFMRISSRVITSEVQERDKAKQTYEAAKSSGHAAALLEQERPNIFTQSVANIPPKEKVFIHIKYVHELKYDEGKYRFHFPMTVGHRYTPPQTPDPERIVPPYLKPGERSGHDIRVTLNLNAGLPIAGLKSISHELAVQRPAPGRALIALKPNDTIPNKDFLLEYKIQAAKPEFTVLTHKKDKNGDGYLMLLLQPQPKPNPKEVTPKEMVFVVDTSGSMAGEPIAKVKDAMRKAIKGMNPQDSFQIIRFDQASSSFMPGPVPNTPENIRQALSYINGFAGAGGTNMIEGIKASLDYPKDPNRQRIVLFMTDGYVGNDTEIIKEVKARLNGAMLCSFGIGSSVNRYLLDKMAENGRGFVQYVRYDQDATQAIQLFYRRVQNPLLQQVTIDWGGLSIVDALPRQMPDLFDAQPQYVFARYSQAGTGTIRLKGTYAGKRYERSLPLTLPEQRKDAPQLAPVWARKQIDHHTTEGFANMPAAKEAITALGLKFKLMTAYTSFVAVERTVQQDVKLPLETVLIPSEMPEGVSYEGVFGKDAAVVSIPRMKPGDPVLSVNAPPNTAAVIADFPFGKRQLCRYDRDSEKFQCRFLVPREVKDGSYIIAITCVGEDGSQTAMEATYVVDSQAPMMTVEAKSVNGSIVLTARPKSHVLETKKGPKGLVTVVHDVKRLVARLPDGRAIPMRLSGENGDFVWTAKLPRGVAAAVLEAVDYAGNESRQAVVLP